MVEARLIYLPVIFIDQREGGACRVFDCSPAACQPTSEAGLPRTQRPRKQYQITIGQSLANALPNVFRFSGTVGMQQEHLTRLKVVTCNHSDADCSTMYDSLIANFAIFVICIIMIGDTGRGTPDEQLA
jgi:hypothetical protein